MANRKAMIFTVGVLVLFSFACGQTGTVADVDQKATAVALGIQGTKMAQDAATLEAAAAESTVAAQNSDVSATAEAVLESLEATQAAMQAAATVAQPEPAVVEPPTAEAPTLMPTISQDALKEQEMREVLQKMLDKSQIRSIEGEFYSIDDFEQVWYDPKVYQTWRIGHSTGNFVIRATAEWRASDPTKGFDRSGCGFVYGETDEDHLHASILSPDGVVHTFRVRGSENIEMKGGHYYGNLGGSSGEAEIMLVVENKQMAFFVNGVEAVRFKDPYIENGNIGLTVMTTSLSGFQCKMTNIGYLELD